MGADIHIIQVDDHWDLETKSLEVVAELEAAGIRAHYIPVSGTTPMSCLGYVSGGLELVDQLQDIDVSPDAIYTPFGTGGVLAGLMTAFRASRIGSRFVGVSVNRDEAECARYLDKWWTALGELLDLPPNRDRGIHTVTADYLGSGYGDPTESTLDAIMRVAETEGILLDPVYSGKTLSGLLDHAATGAIAQGEKVVMVHTGGVPAIFAYHEAIEAHIEKRRGS